MSPVRGHLATVRVGICFGADSGEQLFERRHSQLQTECAIAIVRIEPVVTRFQDDACGNKHRLMTRTADLEEDPVLSLHLDLFVVDTTRQIHRAIHVDQQLAVRQIAGLRRFRHARGWNGLRRQRPSDRLGGRHRRAGDLFHVCEFVSLRR